MTEKTETSENKAGGTEGVQRCVIKPCPFCGKTEVDINYTDNLDWAIICVYEGCMINPNQDGYETDEDAIYAWNERAI